MDAVDLFAGPGGWDVAADALGIWPLGVERDAAACATREAAGHRTLRADVSELDPLEHGPCELLIASPPCPTFSAAGDRAGGQIGSVIYDCLEQLSSGRDGRAEARDAALAALLPTAKSPERARRDADMTLLVVEPLRWILALRPRLVALEQVPPVLPVWERLAEILRGHGYQAWAGVLSSEQYGVPQTRARAILLARLDAPAEPPAPTHQRYVAPPRESAEADRLFDPGPRGRIVVTGDEHLAPWVSMADALGWGSGRAGFARRNDTDDGEDYRERDLRDVEAPAFALTEKARSWEVELGEQPARTVCGKHTPRWFYQSGQERATVRADDEPAPTLAFGHDSIGARFVQRERSGDRAEEGFDPDASPAQALTSKARSWRVQTNNFTAIARDADGQRSKAGSVPYERDADAPAPTVDTAASGWKLRPVEEPEEDWPAERPSPTLTGTRKGVAGHQLAEGQRRDVGGWPGERPSTTVAGDPRIPEPGHKGYGERNAIPQMRNAVRITVEEAAVLQGFPPGYPWQGSRTRIFEQIGNAVPPPLAYAVLRALLA